MTSMDDPEVRTAAASALADTLLAHFAAPGYPRCEPPILQPASVFLDLSGEDIRHRLFLSSDASGADTACRPSPPFRLPGLSRRGRCRASRRLFLLRADLPVPAERFGRVRPGGARELLGAGIAPRWTPRL